MKTTFIIFALFSYSLFLSQNTVEYGKYSMDKPQKQYKIVLGYDNEPSLTDVLIGVESEDALFNKATLVFGRYEFYAFVDYLDYLIDKKKEWDQINIANKIKSITKTIEYSNLNLKTGIVYENGPTLPEIKLYSIYSFNKVGSGLQIATVGNSRVNSSYIFFPSTKSLELFRDKLKLEKLEEFVKEEFRKQSLLK